MYRAGHPDPDLSLADPHIGSLGVGQQRPGRIDPGQRVGGKLEAWAGQPRLHLGQLSFQPDRRRLLDRLEQARQAGRVS